MPIKYLDITSLGEVVKLDVNEELIKEMICKDSRFSHDAKEVLVYIEGDEMDYVEYIIKHNLWSNTVLSSTSRIITNEYKIRFKKANLLASIKDFEDLNISQISIISYTGCKIIINNGEPIFIAEGYNFITSLDVNYVELISGEIDHFHMFIR